MQGVEMRWQVKPANALLQAQLFFLIGMLAMLSECSHVQHGAVTQQGYAKSQEALRNALGKEVALVVKSVREIWSGMRSASGISPLRVKASKEGASAVRL